MKHFIFGYGSLICPQSRSQTAPTLQAAIAEPVIIYHIERTWSARVLKGDSLVLDASRDHIRGWTPMGIRKRQGASALCVGGGSQGNGQGVDCAARH